MKLQALLTLSLALPAVAFAQPPSTPPPQPAGAAAPSIGVRQSDTHILLPADAERWGDAPAVLPAGARAAVIEGDPAAEGLFTLRLAMPDGYRLPPHFHGSDEHVTVLRGTFAMGLGERWNDAGMTDLHAGGFAVMPAGTRHYAVTRGETVIQLHAVGPWKLTYVNPADDPRRPR